MIHYKRYRTYMVKPREQMQYTEQNASVKPIVNTHNKAFIWALVLNYINSHQTLYNTSKTNAIVGDILDYTLCTNT